MWKCLKDDNLGATLRKHPFEADTEETIRLLEKLRTKEYADLLFVAVGMGHARLSTSPTWQDEDKEPAIGLTIKPGSYYIDYSPPPEAKHRQRREISCCKTLKTFDDAVAYVGQLMIRAQSESQYANNPVKLGYLSVKGEFRGGTRGGYARVHIDADLSVEELRIAVDLDDDEWNDQIRKNGFAAWQEGAVYGVKYALEEAKINSGDWKVRRIVGLMVDTTPAFLVFASAMAAWKIIGFVPPDDFVDRLHNMVRANPDELAFPRLAESENGEVE